jgi:L,D-transpeptidase YcbB
VTIPEDGPKLAPGGSHRDIALIRKRLGVPANSGEENLYDAALAEAVKAFQTKKNLSPSNGVVNGKTRQALNANAGQQVSTKTILANMEEWRWMPEDLGETYVWVNVPEFTLRVVKDGKVVHTERIIVGTLNMQTPIFSEDLQTIYFHPRWYIPESIKLKEIAPRASSYIRRHGLRVARNGREIDPESVRWSGADIREYDIFQSPGPDNALGILKFTFPNKHAVYMHDTPNKDLFDAEQRTFSHGCIRVRNPARLAEVLLALDKDWNSARIAELIKAEPRENGVTLDKRIPVHITYFSAEVDDDGELVTQKDIYGHEKRITLALAGKWNEIDKGPDHLAQIELAQQLEDTPRSSRSYGGGGGNRGGPGWEPPAGVSRGVTANDIFRQNFGF